MMTLEERYQEAARLAKDLFAMFGYVRPFWLMEDEKGERRAIMSKFESPEGKAAEIGNIRKIMARNDIVAYCFICEGWMVIGEAKETPEALLAKVGGKVSAHPDRKEIVAVHAEDHDGSIGGHYFIFRQEEEKASLSSLVTYEAPPSGTFTNLLPAKKPPSQTQAVN